MPQHDGYPVKIAVNGRNGPRSPLRTTNAALSVGAFRRTLRACGGCR